MRVLVIGSGGREHALAWKLARSSRLSRLFVAPGNGGTEAVAENVPLDITDHQAVVNFCRRAAIDFVVVGPDAQVVAGLGDDVRAAGFDCFCPSKAAGQLEGSKSFTKALCDEMGIPTAAYAHFDNEAAALDYVRAQGAPIVIKADGLAAGKGVTVAATLAEAEVAVSDCFGGAFGASGAEVVIEEFMEGEEVSLFVALRRHRYAVLWHRTGPQACLRRRHRAQHRRHGRLFTRPGDDPGTHRSSHADRSLHRPSNASLTGARLIAERSTLG